MLVMVPVVLFINGFTNGDWLDASLFALSVAVGLTPEMLPMIVTTSLAKGSLAMAKEKTIIKNLNSIQNLGAIDILCTDKTGTLTQDEVILEFPLDVHGKIDLRVLRHAFLNSYYQTGLNNLMDKAIINSTLAEQDNDSSLKDLTNKYEKLMRFHLIFNDEECLLLFRIKMVKYRWLQKEQLKKCSVFVDMLSILVKFGR